MRKSKVISRNGKNNGNACLVVTAVLSVFFVYGITTMLILRLGYRNRRDKMGSVEFFPNDHGSRVETHPHLQHHDLSSILLEGLPPLKEKSRTFQDMYRIHRKQTHGSAELSELLEDDPLERVTYLRKRMPIDWVGRSLIQFQLTSYHVKYSWVILRCNFSEASSD